MNYALLNTKHALNLHGISCVYSRITPGVYNVETSTVTTTEVTYHTKAYRKQIKASQYNYPDLINKNASLIYIAADTFVGSPAIGDTITFGTEVFRVKEYQEHVAFGEVVLYRLVSIKD